MNNPGFIVDGQMEQLIINYFCPDHPVRLLNCNGRDVSIEAAAKKVASLIRLMKRNYPIIIIFDREDRPESADIISKNLYDNIKDNEIQEVDIYIGIPDTMIENWILADINSVNEYYNIRLQQIKYEGRGGKSQLRKLISPKKYSETEDGPEIAKKCNLKKILKNSKSFESFYNKLNSLHCDEL